MPGRRAALVLALIAWAVPAVAALAQTWIVPDYAGLEYFRDPTVYARYLVAIFVMVSTERMADGRVALLARQFLDARLLSPSCRGAFGDLVYRADRRAASAPVEGIILLAALGLSVFSIVFTTDIVADSWEGVAMSAEGHRLSWAGVAALLLSNTLFLFLLLRWFWRFLIWAILLRRTSRLELDVIPLHPDQCGGLGFLAVFPGIFTGLIFALGCVVAAALVKAGPVIEQIDYGLWLFIAVWLLLMAAVFLGPLAFFIKPLYLAREAAILAYGRLAQAHHAAFRRKWVDGKAHDELLPGSPDPSSVADLNACVQNIHGMRTIPVDRNAVIVLLAAAGSPLLAAIAIDLSVVELLKLIVGVVL